MGQIPLWDPSAIDGYTSNPSVIPYPTLIDASFCKKGCWPHLECIEGTTDSPFFVFFWLNRRDSYFLISGTPKDIETFSYSSYWLNYIIVELDQMGLAIQDGLDVCHASVTGLWSMSPARPDLVGLLADQRSTCYRNKWAQSWLQ